MTFQQFLQMLSYRKRLILSVLAATVALALLANQLLPKSYTASASVVVDMKGSDNVLGALAPTILIPGYLATQADIIGSERVAERVVKLLGLDKNADARNTWMEETQGQGSFESWLALLLLKKLDVKPGRESNIINIAFKGADPRFAATVANSFVQAYVETSLELKVDPAKQNAAWFDERTQQVRKELEAAQKRLSDYQHKKGITNADDRFDVESARLQELSTQLVAIQSVSAESASRQAQAQGNAEATPEVLQSGLIQSLKADLARLEVRREDIGGRVGVNHPEFERIQKEVLSLREKIASESRRITSGLATSSRVNQQREASIKASLEAQRERVLNLKKQREAQGILVRDVENAQRAFDLVTQRLAQTNLESLAQQTNVAVLTRAVEPAEPSSPKPLLNTLLAIILGTILGVGIALFFEFQEQRIRTLDDVAALLDLPALASITLVEGRVRKNRLLALSQDNNSSVTA